MSLSPEYGCDTEFFKLLMRSEEVDLTTVTLELARDAYPQLDFAPTLDWIGARASELSAVVARAGSERAVLGELADCLAGSHGIFGERSAYERADSSYLNRVIETGRGIPISLSVLYMAVADGLGLELKGVAAPLHFLTRYETGDGPLFLDAYGRGRVLTFRECVEWLRKISRLPVDRIKPALQPVGTRAIVVRMLNNLKALYSVQERWTAAWHVQHRLAALQPSCYQERRDLALISLRANRPGSAIDLLQSCLQACPSTEKELLQSQLQEAQQQLYRWN